MLIQPRPLCATGTRCWCMMAETYTNTGLPGLLPDLEKLEAQRSACKQVVTAIKSWFEEVKKINLGLASVKTIEKLDDKLKMLWLMAKYGTTNVLKIMAAMRTVPASLTHSIAGGPNNSSTLTADTTLSKVPLEQENDKNLYRNSTLLLPTVSSFFTKLHTYFSA